MTKIQWVALIAVAIIAIGGYFFPQIPAKLAGSVSPTDISATNYTEVTASNGMYIGAGGMTINSGGISVNGSGLFTGGIVHDSVNSTSTVATAVTLTATDIANYESVIMTPNVGLTTFTFPASSTLATFLPLAGEWAQQCWENATGTAGVYLTFAAGTGDTLQVGSTTVATTKGVLSVLPQKTACFTYIRNGGTGSTANDFSIEMSAFQ